MAAVQSSPSSPTQTRSKKNSVVTEPPKFDLESYIGNYKGRTKFERLLLIGLCSTYLGVDALKLAVREAKAGKDTRRYIEAQTHLTTIGPQESEASRDEAWVEKVDKQNQAEVQRLETELKGYKNNLIKESIRMGNEDLGKHFQAIGDLPKAFEAFSRMRQDIIVTKQIIDVSRHLIEVAVEQRNWIAVTSNVQKIKGAMATPEEDKSIQPFIMAADGLANMDNGNYYEAALSFLQTDAGMGMACNTIIAPNDIAIYGGLCALATMERNELNSRVLENSNFRTYLELEPHIRRAITFFVNSRYSACLGILESYRTDYFLDVYLQKHIDGIYSMVRSKSIVQYFIPFSCVTLDSLNQAFAAPGKTIDKELAIMIQREELNARIDTQNRLLTSVPSAPRGALHSEALRTAKEYEREARRRIQHMNLAGADLEIRGSKPRLPGLGSFADDFYESGGRELRSKGYSQGF